MSLKEQRAEKREQNKRVKTLRAMADKPISRSMAEKASEGISKAIDDGTTTEPVWTKLKELHQHALSVFVSIASTKDVLVRDDVKNNIELVRKINPLVTSLIKDLTDLKSILDQLYVQHSDKVGPAKDDDEYFMALDISLRYNSWIEQANLTAGVLSNDVLSIIANSLPNEEGEKIVQDIDG